MSTVSGGPGASTSSMSDILSRAKELAELASLIAAEREAMLGELEQSRRECEALRAQLSEVRATAELKVRQCEILNVQLGELKAAAESEIARERERSKRESEAILSEARLVRARALETARRLDDCVVSAQRFACTLSNDLLSLSKVVAEARAGLETDAQRLSASNLETPLSLSDQHLDRLLGLSPCSPSVEEGERLQGPGIRVQGDGEAVAPSGESLSSTGSHAMKASMSTADTKAVGGESRGANTPVEESPTAPGSQPDHSGADPAVVSTIHRLLVSPIHSFRQCEELERHLAESREVESFKVVGWESLGVTLEIDAPMATDELIGSMVGRFPHLEIVDAQKFDAEVECAGLEGGT